MTEFNEPLWVGMDVDAELARYREEDRRRAAADAPEPIPAPAPRRRPSLLPSLPLLGKEARAPQSPLAA